ncbi:MAG: TonB-dependent receptor [Acidobacteria bacterium]|nr:TonB-dependent receptor [Acidobacteriota bacterium]
MIADRMPRYARLCAWALLLASGLHAQQATLEIEVQDPAGAAVGEAHAALSSLSGAELRSGRTAEDGTLRWGELRPGLYRLHVRADGFLDVDRTAHVRAEGASLTVQLELATLSTSVEVQAEAAPPVATTVTDEAELAEKPSTDLVDNLSSIPGVNIIRRGGTNFDPVLFGLRETQIAMVVDGTRTFAAGPARMDSELSHVEPGHVAGVDVVSGPYALTEGAGAFSAILVRTPDIPRFDHFRMGAATSAGYGLNGANRFARTRLYGGGRSFGFSLRGAGNKGNDYIPGKSGPAVPGDYSNHQFGGKLRFNPVDNQELTLAAMYDEQTGVDYPGRILNAEHFILRSWNGAYLFRQPTQHIRAAKVGLYLNKKSHRMSNREKPTAMDMPGRTPPFALRIDLPTESDTAGGFAWVDFAPSQAWSVKTGFDFYNLDQQAVRSIARASTGMLIAQDRPWPNVSINDQGYYVQTTRMFESGELSGTFRLDTVQANAGPESEYFLANTTGSLKQSETNASFSLAGRKRLARGVSLGAGFGRVVRTATGLERYADRFPGTKYQVSAEFLGDPGMKPEASYQGDLNLEVTRGDLTLNGGAFYRRIEDYISVALDPTLTNKLPMSPPTVFRYVNGDHATFRGYQFGARYALMRMAELRVQGAKVIADDIEQNQPLIARNEPVLGIPPFEMTSALRIHEPTGRFWAEYQMRNVWNQSRVAASRLETPSPGFTLHGIRFGAELPKRFTLNAGIENLGDKSYFEHLNSLNPFTRVRIPEPGRNAYVALTKVW